MLLTSFEFIEELQKFILTPRGLCLSLYMMIKMQSIVSGPYVEM